MCVCVCVFSQFQLFLLFDKPFCILAFPRFSFSKQVEKQSGLYITNFTLSLLVIILSILIY
jgi:hypothetical protein